MEKLLFVIAMVFITMAFVSRRHSYQSAAEDAADDIAIEQNLKNAPESQPESLAFAINKMNRPSTTTAPDPRKSLNLGPHQPVGASTPTAEHLGALIKDIQANSEQSVFALEKGLTETSTADQMAQRLSILQAALSIGGEQNSYRLKDIAMHEMSTNIVNPVENSLNLSPEELSKVETSRMIVNTAFKIYLNTSKGPDEVLSDTQQILNFQRDPITRELIIYDCTARYPDLRGKLGEN